MGTYNPHSPYIIGNEWAPIRQADYTPDAITERGYTFGLDQSATVVSGAYYVRQPPQAPVYLASQFISVYSEDTEDLSGPIHQLIVPVSAIMITGSSAASDGIAALNNPSTSTGVQFVGGGTGDVGLSFNTTAYSQQLFGKRIVNVEFLYGAAGPAESLAATQTSVTRLATTFNNILYASSLQGVAATTTPGSEVNAISLTDMNPFWNPAIFSTVAQWSVYPWRYDELALFDTTGGFTRLIIRMRALLADLFGVALTYAALRITYCEEKRLLYGGDYINSDSLTVANQNNYPAAVGTKFAALRTPTFALGSALPAGRYAVTQTWRTIGNRLSVPPLHTALRQLYELPPQEGLQLNYTYTVDDQFTTQRSDVLPQITLHTAAAIVTGSHPYGTQIGAPVYGAITAVQEIEDDPVGAAASFPQVRFYARKFGNTSVSLRLIDVAAGTSSVTITPTEHDVLPEIVDGWKEVTLRFTTPPTFATAAGDVDWRFDAVGEIAPNQWQIMGADGPSPAGTHAIGPATYYAPVGDTVTLTWQSPAISGTANDPLSDLTLIFSQDPPLVTGFAIGTGTQAVTGIGLDCGSPQRCIPTGIYCNNVTWSAQTALPVTGFAWYELQRSDTVYPDNWETIMQATSSAVTSFCDYEARVGVVSSYRLRVCNVLQFCGPWVTGSATLPSPGVSGAGAANSLLTFTSNRQPSSNLAYIMQFQGKPVETFAFPEADLVQLQQMYGKDFFTAFHPLERGGEQFARSVLVSATAIPVESMANFRHLRDLAWADLPYVCVRDELGNRWYATVQVPDGAVTHNRRRYIAQIRVTQTTGTPDPVDPS